MVTVREYLGFPAKGRTLEAAHTPGTVAAASRSGIRSPWSGPSQLAQIPWREFYAGDGVDMPIGRADALSIPAVARAVQQVTAPLSACPWVRYSVGVEDVSQPAWLSSTAGPVAPQYRTKFVIEDLILGGWSLLRLTRNDRPEVIGCDRVRPDLWSFSDDGEDVLDAEDNVIPPEDYTLVMGPHDGILNRGARTLRGAIALEAAWTKAVRNPNPATILQAQEDTQLTEPEVDALLDSWIEARQDPDGLVAYLPASVKAEMPGSLSPELLVQARNAVAIDIARLVGIPAAAVDAGAVQTSLTYTNTSVGVGLQLAQQGVKPYADALAAALSMDNVTPRGTRIALDMTQLFADAATLSPSGTPTKD